MVKSEDSGATVCDQQTDAPDQSTGATADMATSDSTRGKSPAFQFYPKDFLSSSKVQRMSLTEVGIYIILLSRAWLDGGLPTDVAEIAKLVRLPAARFGKIWRGALSEAFVERGGRLVNLRLDRERKIQADYRKKQKGNADKRWDKGGNATALPEVSVRHGSGNAPLSLPQSASAFAEKDTGASRSVPLVSRRRLDAAFEGPRVWVPQRIHSDFLAIRGNERELWAFYEAVSDQWASGARKADEPGVDMFVFWRARYEEHWPATRAVKPPPDRRPVWARGVRS